MNWFGCSTCGTCQCEAAEISNEKGRKEKPKSGNLLITKESQQLYVY